MRYNQITMKGNCRLFTGVLTLVVFSLLVNPALAALANREAKEIQQSSALPAQLVDLEDQPLDLLKLVKKKRLFFVTLKATWCGVCANQLIRLAKLKSRLNTCGATFIVLGPGPRRELKAIKKRTGFTYPFVEDKGLKLARLLGLELAPGQIQPAIFEVSKERKIIWMQRGRSGVYYGDRELFEYLNCASIETVLSPASAPLAGGGLCR